MALNWGVIGWIALVALLGIYPITYFAYRGFAASTHKQRLMDDFQLLGLVKEYKFGKTFDELYKNTYSFVQFLSYILLIILVSTVILAGYVWRDSLSFIPNADTTMRLVFFSYLGAYAFSIQELIRRYNTFDLQPQVYSSIILRMLLAVCISFVISSLFLQIEGNASTASKNNQDSVLTWADAVAFGIGIFPSVGIYWLQQQANRILNIKGANSQSLPLQNIQGISALHEARLSSMGIDDIQNLATVDIRNILLNTRFDTLTIINWIDQAILYSKVGIKYPLFSNAGISTFHELIQLFPKPTIQDPPKKALDDQANDLNGSSSANLSSKTKSLEDQHKMLAARLGFAEPSELKRLIDYSDYPNYAHIAEYYKGTQQITQDRANKSRKELQSQTAVSRETRDFQADIERYHDMIKSNPKDFIAHVNLANAYFTLNPFSEEAVKVLNDAIKLLDNNIVMNDKMAKDVATAFTNRARVFLDQSKYDEAFHDCNQALLIDSSNKYIYNYLGMYFIYFNCLDEAIENFNKALDLDIRFAEAYLNRGLAYNASGLFIRAQRDFEIHYLLNKSSSFELWLWWGTALLGGNNYSDAIHKFNYAILYDRHHQISSAYSKRGYAYLQKGNFDMARKDFDVTIKKNKNLLEAYDNKALLESRLGNFKEAIKIYRKILSKDSNRLITRCNLAIAYYHSGEFNNARIESEKVIKDAASASFEANEAKGILDLLLSKNLPEVSHD